MPITSSRGNILVGVLIMLGAAGAAVMLFVSVVSHTTSIVALQKEDIELELLGLSAAARAEWLIKTGEASNHIITNSVPRNISDLMSVISGAENVFREGSEGNGYAVGFSQDGKECLVLAYTERHGTVHGKRFFRCSFTATSGESPVISYY